MELRYLPEEKPHDLAHAFHNLPKTMYSLGVSGVSKERGATLKVRLGVFILWAGRRSSRCSTDS